MEKYALIKDNVVQNVIILDAENKDLLEQIKLEHNLDLITCVTDVDCSINYILENDTFVEPPISEEDLKLMAEINEKLEAKQALLDRLGITADEAALLGL
jgi:hypothetical protein